MKIASFNANGIRARLPVILKWLKRESVDVLCVQETKVQDQGLQMRVTIAILKAKKAITELPL